MKKIKELSTLALAAMLSMSASAQVTIKGVLESLRTDDGEDAITESIGSVFEKDGQYTTNYMYGQSGWNYVGFLSIPLGGVQSITWDGTTLSDPVQDPAFNKSEIVDADKNVDWEKAQIAIGAKDMKGNSGSLYANGNIWTVFNRDMQSSEPEDMFIVRKWDAATLAKLQDYPHYAEDKILESAGLAFNPLDKHVYGLFYVTAAQLPESITSDPDYFVDDDDTGEGREGLDAGYAIGRLNTETMEVEIITKGLYYQNFVTFAINSEGRAFALTSGGTSGAQVSGDDDHLTDINGDLTGAQLYEFNLETGNMYAVAVEKTDDETGETYTAYEPTVGATGYASQYRRQSACFAKSEPDKMYWNGYFNSGKGINDYGSWTTLSDKEWRTNGKYDTCLYEVDINTGKATRLSKIKNRMRFSCIWVDGDDNSDGMEIDNNFTGISNVTINTQQPTANNQRYNIAGQKVDDSYKGIVIQNGVKRVQK